MESNASIRYETGFKSLKIMAPSSTKTSPVVQRLLALMPAEPAINHDVNMCREIVVSLALEQSNIISNIDFLFVAILTTNQTD